MECVCVGGGGRVEGDVESPFQSALSLSLCMWKGPYHNYSKLNVGSCYTSQLTMNNLFYYKYYSLSTGWYNRSEH